METPNKTILSAINYCKEKLRDQYEDSELNQIIQLTFLHYFNLNRADLVLNQEEEFSEINFQKVIEVVKELKTNKPLAQILGEWEFYGLSLNVNEHTLIPRPETEELVQLIVRENDNLENLNILDIGTGSGCIALALKKELNLASVSAFDVSKEALKVAKENAHKNKLEIAFNQVDILDWENQKVTSEYDIIVSNPPYITMLEKELMHKNVLDFEPYIALFVENDEPLLFYNVITEFAINHLTENGKLYFEINENYGSEVMQLLIDKNFKNVNLIKDMNGKDRVVKCLK